MGMTINPKKRKKTGRDTMEEMEVLDFLEKEATFTLPERYSQLSEEEMKRGFAR
jgi:hypothetical protein